MAVARQRIHRANGPQYLRATLALAVFFLSVWLLIILLAP